MAKTKKARPRLVLNQAQKAYANEEATKYFNKLLKQKADDWKYAIMLDDRRLLTALVFFGFTRQIRLRRKAAKAFRRFYNRKNERFNQRLFNRKRRVRMVRGGAGDEF